MKKLAALMLLLCTGLFLFSGCSDDKTGKSSSKSSSDNKTTSKSS